MKYLVNKDTKEIYYQLGDDPTVTMHEGNLAVIEAPEMPLRLYGTNMERFEIRSSKEGLKERAQPTPMLEPAPFIPDAPVGVPVPD